MQGETLYPLNQLKGVYPEIYEEKIGKYKGREFLTEDIIPTLNCLWNDVLHLTAVDPKEIYGALAEVGAHPKGAFYRIDPHTLDPQHATVYLFQHRDGEDRMSPTNFAEFNPDTLDQYTQLSQETKDYYKERLSENKKPLLFNRIPHILYKGTINVADLEIVEV